MFNMYYDGEAPRAFTVDGEFFDIALEGGRPVIFDYSHMDMEIIASEEDGTLRVGSVKEKKVIKSIDTLQKVLTELVLGVQSIFAKNEVIFSDATGSDDGFGRGILFGHLDVMDIEINQIVYQLIIDILYDKYCGESEKLSIDQYCINRTDYNWDNSIFRAAIRMLIDGYPDNRTLLDFLGN